LLAGLTKAKSSVSADHDEYNKKPTAPKVVTALDRLTSRIEEHERGAGRNGTGKHEASALSGALCEDRKIAPEGDHRESETFWKSKKKGILTDYRFFARRNQRKGARRKLERTCSTPLTNKKRGPIGAKGRQRAPLLSTSEQDCQNRGGREERGDRPTQRRTN